MIRTIETPQDRADLFKLLNKRELPFTVSVEKGVNRSVAQNKTAFLWYKEISEQVGEEVEDVRARCKLEIGVPILREGSEAFRKTYDRLVRPLDYADKLALIRDTDMPITRLMTVSQMKDYLDTVFKRHAEFGIQLTDPDAMGMAA
jgi:hypothetical protein